VLHKYHEGRSSGFGFLGIFGAAGGAAAGALTSTTTTNTMQLKDINPAVEVCMREKGYEGISSG